MAFYIRLFFPFQFFANGDQRLTGVYVDALIEGRYMLEDHAKRDECLPGLVCEDGPGGGFRCGGVGSDERFVFFHFFL